MIEVFDLDNPGSAFAQRLDAAEKRLRKPFTSFINRLGAGKEDSLDWWVSNLASRNVFASPLYFLACRLWLLDELIRSEGVATVQTSDPLAARVLKEYVRRNGFSVAVDTIDGIPARRGLSRFLSQFRLWISYFRATSRDFFRRSRAARKTRSMSRKAPAEITLVESYVSESRFTPEGDYHDPYFPGILEPLNDEERRVVYFMFTADVIDSYESLYRKARGAKANFLIKEDYLGVGDYLYALLHPLRFARFSFADTMLGPFDMRLFVEQSAQREELSLVAAEGLLNSRLMPGLKKAGIQVQRLVDWFENQWMDRGLHWGFHHCFPASSSVGYQGFVFSKVHLSIYPTSTELMAGVVPRTVGVIGPGYLEERKEFCPELRTVVVPPLRFAHTEKARAFEPMHEPFVVLAALSQIADVSRQIVQALIDISREMPRFDIRLKPHPTVPDQIKQYFPDLPENMRYVDGDFRFHLEQSHVVVGAESGTALEALVLAVPVIVYTGSAAPSKNSVPEDTSPDLWSLCYTPDALLQSILRFQREQEPRRAARSTEAVRLKKKYLAPVTREGIRGLLGLGN